MTSDPDRAFLEQFLGQEVDGFVEALDALLREDEALKRACQAIIWACALDDFHVWRTEDAYRCWRDEQVNRDELFGVRYARDRGLHQFSQLINLSHGWVTPLFPVVPVTASYFAWKPSAALPAPDKKHRDAERRDCYDKHLAGRPVRFTLITVRKLLLGAP
ncbi:MAG TPA: hypothetical protein VMK12_08885 [Anaeromyxobacteraceae bacterium]|nr:hypothetical protein [Anaeromyxobacteraceae bacterium]